MSNQLVGENLLLAETLDLRIAAMTERFGHLDDGGMTPT